MTSFSVVIIAAIAFIAGVLHGRSIERSYWNPKEPDFE